MSYSLTVADQFNLDNSMFVIDKQEDGTYAGTSEFWDVCMMLDLNPIDNLLDIRLFDGMEFKKSPIDLFLDEYILNNGHPDLGLSEDQLEDIDADSMQDLLYDWYRDTYCNTGDTDGDPISLI